MRNTFRSLSHPDYRIWAAGALASNIGAWMQRTAQDWIVLSQLTHHNGAAVGIVTALQFAPQLLLLPFTGAAADRMDRRRLLILTQCGMGLLALLLGLLTLTGLVRLWHVYTFGFLLGCVSAFDTPVRQTFIAELVPEADLPNAVALNSTSFNAARMVGPALAGVLIGLVGSGWLFLLNAASFAAVIASLHRLRHGRMQGTPKTARRGNLLEGLAYVRGRPDLRAILLMLAMIGTFGMHYPIFISTMAVSVFHTGPGRYGLLTAMMATGSVTGAMLAAGRAEPGIPHIFAAAIIFGLGFLAAALMPGYWLFGAALAIIGIAAQTLTTTALSTVQLATDPAMRGRVMALLLAVAMGGTPFGAPLVGHIADRFGPRWALCMGAFAGLSAAAIGLRYLIRHRGLRLHGLRITYDLPAPGV